MLKCQTSRKNFLTSRFLAIFVFAGFLPAAHAQISRCEEIFETTGVASALNAADADLFWSRTAKISVAEEFGRGVVAELGKSPDQEPIYHRLIAPALWNYAHLSAEPGLVVDPARELVNRIEAQLLNSSMVNRRTHDRIRPKAMTRDDREWTNAVGHYGMIDGSRLPIVQSPNQRRRAAIDAAVYQGQAASLASRRQAHSDPLRSAFLDLQRRNRNSGQTTISKSEIDVLLADPTDFAIVYAQIHGLVATSGVQGELLSPYVPWMRPVQNATKYSTLADLAILSRASNLDSPATHAADIVVLEVLRKAFAPQLTEFLP